MLPFDNHAAENNALKSKTKPRTPKSHYDVTIVGGGFSGTILAIQLLKRSLGHITVAVINRAGSPGRGVAYGTEYEEHLLNVCAGKMSAFPDQPEHFFRWLTDERGCPVQSEQFVSRRLYGEYMGEALNKTLREHPNAVFAWIPGNAHSLTLSAGKPHLELNTGVEIEAEIVVLATGNAPPVDPPQLRSMTNGFYASYVWAQDAHEGILPNGNVLILGSGLTAIDQVLTLRARNFQGTMFMLSRHGRLPAVHATSETWPSDWAANLPNSISSIFASVRQQIQLAGSEGVNWRAVIDSLRPFTSQVWQQLSVAERSRFLRHVRPFWEVVRHRIPTETHALLTELIDSEALQIITGRLLKVTEHDHCVDVTFRARNTGEERVLSVDRILNCTGPGTSVRVQDELIMGLLEQGLARMDSLQIGIKTDNKGAVITASGEPSDCFYAIGPVRKASLWETTAVPEIRVQAVQLAEHLLSRLEDSRRWTE